MEPFKLSPFFKDYLYGLVDYDLKVHKDADKGCILNSRILWFFSEPVLC